MHCSKTHTLGHCTSVPDEGHALWLYPSQQHWVFSKETGRPCPSWDPPQHFPLLVPSRAKHLSLGRILKNSRAKWLCMIQNCPLELLFILLSKQNRAQASPCSVTQEQMDQGILPPTHSVGYGVSPQKWVKQLVVVPGLLLSAPGPFSASTRSEHTRDHACCDGGAVVPLIWKPSHFPTAAPPPSVEYRCLFPSFPSLAHS